MPEKTLLDGNQNSSVLVEVKDEAKDTVRLNTSKSGNIVKRDPKEKTMTDEEKRRRYERTCTSMM